ncbi:MAG: DUF192 domain-containing protein [Patescibacteria group bacterium]
MFWQKDKYNFKAWHLVAFGAIIAVFVILKIFLVFYTPSGQVIINEKEIKVLVANTSERWFKGLSGRDTLGEYGGMWFSFLSKDYYTMVMRDMKFPLDIIWLEDGIIVDMAPNVQPEAGTEEASLTKYRPRLPANEVLEMTAGAIEQYGLKIGDKLNFSR